MGLPSINIEFYKKAVSFVARSSLGVVLLLIKVSNKTYVINAYTEIEAVLK